MKLVRYIIAIVQHPYALLIGLIASILGIIGYFSNYSNNSAPNQPIPTSTLPVIAVETPGFVLPTMTPTALLPLQRGSAELPLSNLAGYSVGFNFRLGGIPTGADA